MVWSPPTKGRDCQRAFLKERLNYMLSKRNQFKHKDTDRLKTKWWGKIPHANTNQNKTEVTIFISKRIHNKEYYQGWKENHIIIKW